MLVATRKQTGNLRSESEYFGWYTRHKLRFAHRMWTFSGTRVVNALRTRAINLIYNIIYLGMPKRIEEITEKFKKDNNRKDNLQND